MTGHYSNIDQGISDYAETRKYRRAFRITLAIAIMFAVLAAGIWWRFGRKSASAQSQAAPAHSGNANS